MKYSEITHTDPIMRASDRALWRAHNCNQLASLVDQLADWQFQAKGWAEPADNECGSVGCALGWAAMSNQFQGLQYMIDPETEARIPVVNGEKVDWDDAGDFFFGHNATSNIFWNPALNNKATVVSLLRDEADRLKMKAREAKSTRYRERSK